MDILLLALMALITSAFTAVVGIGGGFLLLVFMVDFFPPMLLIPVHGFIQLSSNASRAFFDLSHVKWEIVKRHAIGATLGGLLGSLSVSIFPFDYLPLVLGSFVLFMTWRPYDPRKSRPHGTMLWMGAGQTYLSFFVGATGPLSYPLLLRRALTRHEIVTTHASMMVVMHLIKVVGYGTQGPALLGYWDFMLSMSVGAILGSYIGKGFRGKVSEKAFSWIAKGLLTMVSLRMLLKFFLPQIP